MIIIIIVINDTLKIIKCDINFVLFLHLEIKKKLIMWINLQQKCNKLHMKLKD